MTRTDHRDDRDELLFNANKLLRIACPPSGREDEWEAALRRWEVLRLDLMARRGGNGPRWSRPLSRLIARSITWWLR